MKIGVENVLGKHLAILGFMPVRRMDGTKFTEPKSPA